MNTLISCKSGAFTIDKFTNEKLLKSGLKLIGAKTKIRDKLYRLFPDHEVYVEPFLGSGNVWIGKSPAKFEMVGDINPYLLKYFSTLKSDTSTFKELVDCETSELTEENGKSTFEKWKFRMNMEMLSDVETSVYFYLITKFALNGIFRFNRAGYINSSYCQTVKGRGLFDDGWLENLKTRLDATSFSICDLSYDKYDYRNYNSNVFVFLDPPYRFKTIENNKGCVTTYNGSVFKDEHYLNIAEIMKSSECKMLLTINDDDFIRTAFNGLHVLEHVVKYSCSQTSAGRGDRPELIITNYEVQS